MLALFSSNLALLNQSQYLPNQIAMLLSTALVVGAIVTLGHRWSSLRRGYTRHAAYLFLLVMAGIVLFKAAGIVPSLRRLQLEPLAHMVEEIGCLGAYAYIAHYQATHFPNVTRRPLLAALLEKLWLPLAAAWAVAATLAIACAVGVLEPYRMTGLDFQTPEWSVFYRSMFLVPGFVVCFLLAYLFIERAFSSDVDPRWATKLTLFGAGTFVWVPLTLVGIGWAIIQAYGTDQLRDRFAVPIVTAEALLFLGMAIFWGVGLTIPYSPNSTDDTRQHHKQFQRLRTKFAMLLSSGSRIVPSWHSCINELQAAGARLNLPEQTLNKVQHALAGIALISQGQLCRQEAQFLMDLRHRLLTSLPEKSPEHSELVHDPMYEALAAALLLTTSSPSGSGASLTPPSAPGSTNTPHRTECWVQLTAALSRRQFPSSSAVLPTPVCEDVLTVLHDAIPEDPKDFSCN